LATRFLFDKSNKSMRLFPYPGTYPIVRQSNQISGNSFFSQSEPSTDFHSYVFL